MGFKRDNFSLSGPLHITAIDWENAHHRRTVAASLVQGVYVLEKDHQENRQGPQALAPPWWEFFHFQLLHHLVDDADSSIFGAIYEFKPSTSNCHYLAQNTPRYVIAFRGTITKLDSLSQDLQLDIHIIQNVLHRSSRFEIAMQAVRDMVAATEDLNIWLAGHSLGSAIAMLAGKNMAKMGVFLKAFLFNPPFFSAPIESIKDKKLKHGIRIASSFITALLTVAIKDHDQRLQSENSFAALVAWVPYLFVNPEDHICSEYIGYFENRGKMEAIGAEDIERLATQNSIGDIFLSAFGRESEPLHLLPSANLTVNLTPSPSFRKAHGIHQWWRPDLRLQFKTYNYR